MTINKIVERTTSEIEQITAKKTEQIFQWSKNWYPLSPISYLNPSIPNAIELLGKKLVIWKNNLGDWVVMDDVCPHKLIELSKGKIDSNAENIVCRYHGWCFNSKGDCTKIPALDEEDAAQKTACQSDRSKVNIYPNQVVQDLLWIWPDDSSEAFEESLSLQPATMPEDVIDTPSNNWYMREVPVGYAVSVENSFDPIHAQFVHEGIAFFSPEKTVPMREYKLVSEISKEGFTLKHSGYNKMNEDMEATRQFKSPCSNTTIYTYINGNKNLFQLYFIPTKPGYCRYIGQFLGFVPPSKKSFWQQFLPEDLLIGLQHSSSYQLVNQDLNVISSQEVAYSQVNKTWSKAYYLPTNSDFGSSIFRKWLEQFAGGDPFGKDDLKRLPDRQLYDRWNAHSKFCPHCRNSVEILEKIRGLCDRSTKILILLALISIVIGIPLKIGAILIILGFVSFWVSSYVEDKRHDFMTSIPKRGLPEVKLY
ncbi:MAG: Rieske 2Fe-2S domain-containing protein [Prochloraceae cyanobacterium]|nr:Rieske 2Fe-2S domain-containing protein [Prochloraceae cyanobacterium]